MIWDTVPRRERRAQARRAAELRESLRPTVARLLEELSERALVVERLRGDTDPSGARRAAAPRVLFELTAPTGAARPPAVADGEVRTAGER